MVLEGVHLVPGLLPKELEGALLVHVVIEIADENVHQLHFHVRDSTTGGVRAMDKYLGQLDAIRRIQTYIVGRARREAGTGDRECQRGTDDRPGDRARHAGCRAVAAARVTQPTDDTRQPCQCESFARVTERALSPLHAGSGGPTWRRPRTRRSPGARLALERMPISGRIVIGSPEEAEQLAAGTDIGLGGEEYDLALDPLEGRSVVARGGTNAISMIAAAPRGSMPSLPDMYMRKMAVGPRVRGKVSLSSPVDENIRAIAQAFDRMVNDVTAIVLDRPRHHDLIEEIRASGARIKLIQDGDVTASISAAVRGTNDHLAIGIGGTRQAVLSAAALRCLGGELQAQLWPTRPRRDRRGGGARHRRRRAHLHHRRPCAPGGDRRGDRCLERRPAPRRPVPRRLGSDALARHVHPLQLGALRGRDPLLRPRAT